MTVQSDVQRLEPGNLIEVFDFDLTPIDISASLLHFHPYPQETNIVWKGVVYPPWPIQAEGFMRTSDKPPNPTISVSNIDGSITALCIQFDDMVGAILTRRRTFSQYLDAVNFPGGVNPTADPTQELPNEVWYVERKSSEDSRVVKFELSSAMDFNGIKLPRRQIIANQCPWKYRSAECSYVGGAVATENDVPTADINLDSCGKRVASCKLRFGEKAALPHGGFPAAGLMR
jgi:lambda family phage minor tail protein L